ncbi:MAG: hypothetical protein AAF203_00575, partial [Pseudomonadota bacterium]
MLSPLGGFYSSIGGNPGLIEGSFHTWQEQEISTVLDSNELKHFKDIYFLNRSTKRYGRRRTLRRKTSFLYPQTDSILKKLNRTRNKKGLPPKDKKVVTSFTSYMISSLIDVQKVWPSDDLRLIIQNQLDFLLRQHRNRKGFLFRRSIGGEVFRPGILDDYAFFIEALIKYYEISFDEKYLNIAYELQKKQNDLFWDSKQRVFRLSNSSLLEINQQKVFKDQNLPSGQSVSYENLVRLSLYFTDRLFDQQSRNLLEAYPDQILFDPLSYPHLLLGLDFSLSNPKVVITKGTLEQCRRAVTSLSQSYNPYTLFACARSKSRIPITQGKGQTKNLSYLICDRTSCSSEIRSLDEVKKRVFER